MSKIDLLTQKLGTNIAESVGSRPAGASPVNEPSVNRYAGYRRNQHHGEMQLDMIIPDPNQPRKTFDEQRLQELTASITTLGVLTPIRIRWDAPSGKWIIISGENRWRASKRAGKGTIPCILVEQELSEENIRIEQLVENCQRTNLRPLEQAAAIQRLSDQTSWSAQRLATELSLSKATVVRSLALLKLAPEVQTQLENGSLTASVGYALSQVSDLSQQQKLATMIARRSLSREAALQLIERQTTGRPEQANSTITRQFKTPYGTVTFRLDRDQNTDETIKHALESVLQKVH